MPWLDLLTLFATLLMCGNELAVSAFINPALWKRNDPELPGEFARTLGAVMPFWYGLCLLLLAAEAFLRRNQPGDRLLLAAAMLWATVIVWTITMLVPLNNRLAAIIPGSHEPDWRKISRKWDILHRFRIAALALSAALLYRGLSMS